MMKFLIFCTDIILVNLAFLLSFLIRYGPSFPNANFTAYKNSFVFVTILYMLSLSLSGAYKTTFRSSWNLFKRISKAVCLATLLSVVLVYVFRRHWGAFPSSVFAISLCVNLVLIFKTNQFILKKCKRIKKQVAVFGEGDLDEFVDKKANVERKPISELRHLLNHSNIDEIIISEKLTNPRDLNLLLYVRQKLKAKVFFSPAVYLKIMQETLNGEAQTILLNTFIGRKSELEENFIRLLDIAVSIIILLITLPAVLIIALLIKLTSPGPVLYKQERVGHNGNVFTLIKLRTMTKDAEKQHGPVLARLHDPRVTKIGRYLRRSRLDELPQLINVIKGEMSLVGPRPERPHFVKLHKALQGVRLAVKPGLTGMAQVRNFYDLHPRHKIKYDYLYIQRRSFLLNVYILMQTVPAIFSKKGW